LENVRPLTLVSEILEARARHLKGLIGRNIDRFGIQWEIDFDDLVGSIFSSSEELTRAVLGYISFSNQSMRSQAKFQKTGRYENVSFEEADRIVYQDRQYMTSEYLPGLLLSHLLWPHHYAQLCFFRDVIKDVQPRLFSEIGVGTGLYSLLTLRSFPESAGVGIDISASSLGFAKNLISGAGIKERYSTLECDISSTTIDIQPDFVISVELLEHLEQPQKLLNGICNLIGAHGTAFVTAALNAAHTDHIYLYSKLEEVEIQVRSAGFSITDMFYEEAYRRRNESELVPAVVAFSLSAE
jgi:2-polyprenyl-3-methyl-5-hydroxy-6-metoxy-1,4-benzoquinol methylase